MEQGDDFAGRVKAKRVEVAPGTTMFSLAGRLNDGRLPWRFGRPRFLRRGNPACGSIRNCGGFRPKCEHFDDVLRDPRRYSH